MIDDLESVFEEIQQLLDAPRSGTDAPPLDTLEHTLTSGYARALALEAERWRLERRLGEVAATLAGEKSDLGTQELIGLAKRLSNADGELTRLRSLLGSLRVRATEARATA